MTRLTALRQQQGLAQAASLPSPAGAQRADFWDPTQAALAGDALQQTRGIFASAWPAATLAGSVLEHGSRALGHYYLTCASSKLAQGRDPSADFAAYALLSHCVPAVPQALAALALLQWRQAAARHYDALFLAHHFNHPRLWAMSQGDNNQKAQVTFLFSEQLRWAVENAVQVSAELGAMLAQTATQIAGASASLGAGALTSLAVGVLGAGYHAWQGRSPMLKNHMAGKRARADISAHRQRAWDNVKLGNLENQQRWFTRYEQVFAAWSHSVTDRARLVANTRMGATAACLAPVVATLTGGLLAQPNPQATAQFTGALVQQLPQAIAVVRSGARLGERLAGHGAMMWKNLQLALDSARNLATLDIDALCKAHDISLFDPDEPGTALDVAGLRARVQQPGATGWMCLVGANGAGKSMLLLALKELAGTRAELLPAHASLLPRLEGSTGEQAMARLALLLRTDAPVLLLDETSAHLSPQRALVYDSMLREASKTRLIVEVTHRRSAPGAFKRSL